MPEGAYTPKNLFRNLEVEMTGTAEAPARRWSARLAITACIGLSLMLWLVLAWGMLGLAE
jgi:hypothetical protein